MLHNNKVKSLLYPKYTTNDTEHITKVLLSSQVLYGSDFVAVKLDTGEYKVIKACVENFNKVKPGTVISSHLGDGYKKSATFPIIFNDKIINENQLTERIDYLQKLYIGD